MAQVRDIWELCVVYLIRKIIRCLKNGPKWPKMALMHFWSEFLQLLVISGHSIVDAVAAAAADAADVTAAAVAAAGTSSLQKSKRRDGDVGIIMRGATSE